MMQVPLLGKPVGYAIDQDTLEATYIYIYIQRHADPHGLQLWYLITGAYTQVGYKNQDLQ